MADTPPPTPSPAEEAPPTGGLRERFAAPFKKLLTLEGSPAQLSYSFGYGMFIGLLPGPGWPIVIATRLVVKAMHLPAAMAGTLVSNPYTFIPLWTAGYWLGNQFLHRTLPRDMSIAEWAALAADAKGPRQLWELVQDWLHVEVMVNLILPLLLGLTIISLIGSIIATVTTRRWLEKRLAAKEAASAQSAP